ncbi:macrophage-expressed gene 1 protein-like [Sycon ciliatum]|uniref:macrophage-expressed gene 1 protein-like n=1 Tax=Sycon ciliatum TaxID=27933 RepID=UPI0031F6DC79
MAGSIVVSVTAVVLVLTVHVAAAQSTEPENESSAAATHGQDIPTWKACEAAVKTNMRMEVLPGIGWDNLNNRNMGVISDFTYEKCQVTGDLRYLIPDQVIATPLKKSKVMEYAQSFSKFTDYKSTLSQSMSLDTTYNQVSGSLSQDYYDNKINQVKTKSSTTRCEIRHELYKLEVQPDAPLSPPLKNRLMIIGGLVHSNQFEAARFEIDLIIRDFGTHIVRSVTAGGVFMQETQVSKLLDKKSSSEGFALGLELAASDKFSKSADLKFKIVIDTDQSESFTNKTSQSTTKTHGGPSYKPGMSADAWEKGLATNLVAVDRSGDPLEFAITEFALPELPAPTVRTIQEYLGHATQAYVKYNTHPGCLDVSSVNFNFGANVADDSLCKSSATGESYKFGGVYQTCTAFNDTNNNVCKGLQQNNPSSGGLQCPPDYDQIKLFSGERNFNWHTNVCSYKSYKCGSVFHRRTCSRKVCHTVFSTARAEYDAFWCAELVNMTEDKGYAFGGLFTNTMSNLVTGSKSCPDLFYPLKIGSQVRVCVSEDHSRQTAHQVQFGGFFSCSTGNPLALVDLNEPKRLDKLGFNLLTGEDVWPHQCPHGYAQRLAEVSNGCEIYYCIKQSGHHAPYERILINRPPYGRSYPMPSAGEIDTASIVGPGGETWRKNLTTGAWKKENTYEEMVALQDSEATGWAVGTLTLISVVVILIIVLSIVLYKYRIATRNQAHSHDSP